MITGLDHVQVAIPAGGEPAAREFYGGLLGMTELDSLYDRLAGHGYPGIRADGELPGIRRFHVLDPFGNRIEFQQA